MTAPATLPRVGPCGFCRAFVGVTWKPEPIAHGCYIAVGSCPSCGSLLVGFASPDQAAREALRHDILGPLAALFV